MANKKPDTIKVYRPETNETREFEFEAWNALPGHKYGWKKKADEPDEVKNLKGKGAENASDTATSKEKEKAAAPSTEEAKPNAKELAEQIYAAESVEAVDALVPDGETRKTVTDAAAKRKEQLSEKE